MLIGSLPWGDTHRFVVAPWVLKQSGLKGQRATGGGDGRPVCKGAVAPAEFLAWPGFLRREKAHQVVASTPPFGQGMGFVLPAASPDDRRAWSRP